MTNAELIAKIDALYEKATPGWHQGRVNRLVILTGQDHPLCEFSEAYHRENKWGEGQDPELMVALFNAWPQLRAALAEKGEGNG